MERVVAILPAYVSQPNHIEMLRIQSTISTQLGIPLLVVVDYVADEYCEAFHSLNFPWLFWMNGKTTGTRRPTEEGIRHVRRIVGDCYLFRFIQDCFITDANKLKEQMGEAVKLGGDWIAGGLKTFTRHPTCLEQRGVNVPYDSKYQHIHGEFVFSPLNVWEKYYLPMPLEVTHFGDDDIFSQWVMAKGGRLIAWENAWQHLHNCSAEKCREIYERKLIEIKGNSNDSNNG